MKITRIAAIGLIAATVSVAGFAGCGGSDSSSASSAADTTAAAPEMTEAEFVAAATKVCTDVKTFVKNAGASLDATSLESLQTFAAGAADKSKAAMAELRAITPPAAKADAYQAFLDAKAAVVDSGLAQSADVQVSTSIDDVIAKTSTASTAEVALNTTADTAAVAAGLPECGGK